MRKEYDLRGGRPNPYARRIGAKGREVIVQRYLRSLHMVRLADDVAAEFEDEASVNEALRLVLQLRRIAPGQPKPKRARPARSATAGTKRAA